VREGGEDLNEHNLIQVKIDAHQHFWKAWTEAQLQPYLETVLEVFGPTRLIFGTDWPVCLVGCLYGRWYDVVSRFAASLSSDEQASLFGHSAARAYSLPWPG
jgi:L-fuconolactonase